MLSIVHGCAIVGIEGQIVEVETDFNPRAALPQFNIVGLPDSAVRESRERVRAAIKNSNMQFVNKAYVVNLSPADLPKSGPAYDLSIAVGVLAATDQVPMASLEGALFIGELSLDGAIRHVKGVMSMALAAAEAGLKRIFVPVEDAREAALIGAIEVFPVESLGQLVEHLYNLAPIAPFYVDVASILSQEPSSIEGLTDFADIRGQEGAKRALEIAAAGNHNLRMTGPPGSGKTLLARALPGILPRLALNEALDVTRIYSVADMLSADQGLMLTRPFRAPHHTISLAGMVGGGAVPRPGEVTLAHRGVLFLDEVNEHGQHTLEGLRQPIEDKFVTISRAKGTLTFPANFLLILAHNPCPCGYLGDPIKPCTCTPAMISRYQSKLSGPLLDRVDIHIEVPRVDYDKLLLDTRAEPSRDVRARVESARAIQLARFAGTGLYANGDMDVKELNEWCVMEPSARQLLETAVRRMSLSARSYHRMMKLSRTIADLAESALITVTHVAEAVQYRPKMGGT
ncbi:MAG: YifB family Mg chelatase-like AAA ATPase [Chloroflexota bacterium]|nr:YifB family Mg chelatase-like AAA ATPase [Chloroflexota bacterium]